MLRETLDRLSIHSWNADVDEGGEGGGAVLHCPARQRVEDVELDDAHLRSCARRIKGQYEGVVREVHRRLV